MTLIDKMLWIQIDTYCLYHQFTFDIKFTIISENTDDFE